MRGYLLAAGWIAAIFSVPAAVAGGRRRSRLWWRPRGRRSPSPAEELGQLELPSRPARQRVALILNPVKNRAEEVRALVLEACAQAGWDAPLVLETTVDEPGRAMARQALEARSDVVIVAGGDGTVRVVAGELARTGVAMGIVPAGTGNLLARNLGLDVNDLAGNVVGALHGSERSIDMGSVRLENGVTGDVHEDTFLVIAGIGLDAKVVADTREELKRRMGWLAYSEAGFRNLPGKRHKFAISIDGGRPQIRKVQSVLFANCGLLPGGIDFIPEAEVDDGVLDIVVMTPRSPFGWMWVAGKVLFRHRRPIPVLTNYRARTVRVATVRPTETQLDGDISGEMTEVTVQVQPRSLIVRSGSPVLNG